MLRFLAVRLALIVPTFLGVTLVAFAFIHLIPGDPIEVLAGERGVTPARHAELMAEFGYDRPLWEQYLGYLGDLLQGDLGRSLVTRQPVVEEFLHPLPGDPSSFPWWPWRSPSPSACRRASWRRSAAARCSTIRSWA